MLWKLIPTPTFAKLSKELLLGKTQLPVDIFRYWWHGNFFLIFVSISFTLILGSRWVESTWPLSRANIACWWRTSSTLAPPWAICYRSSKVRSIRMYLVFYLTRQVKASIRETLFCDDDASKCCWGLLIAEKVTKRTWRLMRGPLHLCIGAHAFLLLCVSSNHFRPC